MSTISIGGAERPLAVADAGWIGRAFDEHASAGELPCVRVVIRGGNVDMKGRPPSREEAEISRLWSLEGLSSTRFTAAQIAAFVECVGHLLR